MGLPISGVAKDREDFDSSHICTTELLHKIRFTADLKGDETKPEMFTDIQFLSCVVVCNKACNLQSVQVKRNTKKFIISYTRCCCNNNTNLREASKSAVYDSPGKVPLGSISMNNHSYAFFEIS